MTFNTEVIGCYWQEETGEWKVKLRKQVPGQEPHEFEEHCHVLLYGAGVLNNFKVCLSHDIFLNRKVFKAGEPVLLQIGFAIIGFI